MKKTIVILISIIGSHSPFRAQTTFERTYGGPYYDAGSCVLQTSDEGYIIVGTSRYRDSIVNYLCLIKTDAYGDTIWTKVYGGDESESGTFIQETSDSGFIVVGATRSFGAGASDIYLLKTNAAGDTLWTKTFGGSGIDYGHCVRQTEDNGYIIAGHTESYGSGSRNVYLVRTDASGDTVWTRVIGGSQFDWCKHIEQVYDNGYVIVGSTSSFGAGDDDVYLIKVDASGDTLWTRTYGGANYDRAYSFVQTPEGYIIVGTTESFGAGKGDIYIIKTTLAGDSLWTKTIGGTGDERAHFIQRTQDGGFIIVGYSESFNDSKGDVFLMKTDTLGEVMWKRSFGGPEFDNGNCVRQTSDKGYIITGSFKSGPRPNDYDICFIKTDEFGLLTGIDHRRIPVVPEDLILRQNYPNPFNESTTISYVVAKPSRIKLELFTGNGSLLMQVFDKRHQPGKYQWKWNPENLDGGIYFYRLSCSDGALTGKMILLK